MSNAEAAALLAAAGLAPLVAGCLGALGRLRRNALIGIRLPSTMRDDETWRRAHRAAGAPLVVAGLALEVGAGAALLVRHSSSVPVIAGIAATACVVAVLVATARATRAARPGR